MSLWAEIRQRRITQFVLTYIAGGWMALVVVDQVVDREVLPPVVYQVGLTLYLVGILAALIVGWYHGEKGEQRVTASEVVWLILVAALALGSVRTVIRTSNEGSRIEDVLAGDDLRRIAVLYLQDMSSDGSMAAVADGITEGVISRLSEVRELRVTSRNGSREARAMGAVSPDSVASVLDVGALVDGTVDQSGDELLVAVRLLEGSTGQPLVRETYRWPMDQVATVGRDLGTEIATALREQLGMEIRLREGQARAPNSAAWLHVARAARYLADAREQLRAGDGEAASAAFDAAEAEALLGIEAGPEWADPRVLYARVAYERYVLAHDAHELTDLMATAVDRTNDALELEPDNAAALELRGTARYRRYLLFAEDEAKLEELFRTARADLTRAETLAPDRATVHSTLSHLYNQVDDWAQAAISARRAYELDAFLDAADGVLWRLFTSYYDLGDHLNAQQTCEQGHERFPSDYRFTQCALFVMTMPDARPDIAEAWALRDRLLPLLVDRPELFDAQSRIVIGGIIGRAGLADSAQAVLAAARVGPAIDPERELLSLEAAMRSVMGDVDGSIRTLATYVASVEHGGAGEHWWWRNVLSHPDFERYRLIH